MVHSKAMIEKKKQIVSPNKRYLQPDQKSSPCSAAFAADFRGLVELYVLFVVAHGLIRVFKWPRA
jgi:hypothetical protein